jgi:cbb3-type cytochrome oxidase subunit 3
VIELLIFSSIWLNIAQIDTTIFFIIHTLTAVIASYGLSQQWKQNSFNHAISWLILFSFIFFIPVIGAIILWMFSIRKRLRQAISEEERIIEENEQTQKNEGLHYFSAPKHHHHYREKQTRALISTLDDDTYLKLLVSTRHLPDKEAYTLLKEALSSPFESARLMAFSLKGKLEERLQKELQQKIENLKLVGNKSNSAELHLSIAKDYIHLLDIGLLTESNETLLSKAKKHCVKAIHLNDKSAYAFQALSKILKHQGQNKQAQRAQIKAVGLGLPLDRLYAT